MQVSAGWLSLLLAGPGLAASPVAGSSDEIRGHIFTVIKESDPEEMTPPRTPRPLSELVEAAELAAAELARATPAEVYELLSLLHDARGLAYRLSGGDAAHLCAELGALVGLMQRHDLEKTSADRVKRFDAAGRSTLAREHAGHVCEVPQEEVQEVMLLPVSQAPQEVTPSQLVVNPGASRRAKASSATIAGGVLLAVAGGLAVAVAPVQVSRVRLRDEANELRGVVDLAGGATPEQVRQAEALERAADRTRIATVSLSASAAAVAALGVVLVVVGVRKPRRLEVLPQGGPQGAGLLLQGRF